LKVYHKQRNIYTTVWHKEKISNVLSNSKKKKDLFATTGRQDRSQFLDYFYGLAGEHPVGLTRCHINSKPNKNKVSIHINLIWLNLPLWGNDFKLFHFLLVYWYYSLFLFQNWGDYANMSQAVALYVIFSCNAFLICWFGTQLTQHVRVNGLLLLLFLQRIVENADSFQQIRNLELLSVVETSL
jgi:hypothetical protein